MLRTGNHIIIRLKTQVVGDVSKKEESDIT